MVSTFSTIRFPFCVVGLLVVLGFFAACESNTGAWLEDKSDGKKRHHDELLTAKELYERSLVLPLQVNFGSYNHIRSQDSGEVREWYEKESAGGNVDAMTYLGACYYDGGTDDSPDKEKALQLYQQACAGGSQKACGLLGLLHLTGTLEVTNSCDVIACFTNSTFFPAHVVDIHIQIEADGSVLVEGLTITIQELDGFLREVRNAHLAQGNNVVVTISPCQHAPHKKIVDVVDVCTQIPGLQSSLLVGVENGSAD